MAKIFVSYKHSDNSVAPLKAFSPTTARDYVDKLEEYFEKTDDIYKGEKSDEDLGSFKDETIESHLRNKIFDSSITIVLISKGMKEFGTDENEQWIPWEISYSLKEITRNDRTSRTNAMLAVALPDENNSYQYFVEHSSCPHCNTINWKKDTLFKIIGQNMFNRKQPKTSTCVNGLCGSNFHTGNDHSYIHPVKWENFISDVKGYVSLAEVLRENKDDFEIVKII